MAEEPILIDLLAAKRFAVELGDLSFMLRPQQREIAEWVKRSKSIVSVVHAARGYGKTYLSLVMAIEQGLRWPNQRIIFACPTREQARQIAVPTMAMLASQLEGILEIKKESTGHQFSLENGTAIILEGADDDRGNHLRGPFAQLIICDEAGFWRHLDYVVRSVLLPQAQRCGGRLVAISTSPESVGHEFVSLCERAKRSDSYLRRTIDDNKHISAGERNQFIEELGGPHSTATKRELYCEFVVEANRAVIPEFSLERHTTHDLGGVPEWRDRYVSIDLGFKDNSQAVLGYWDFNQATLCIEDEVVGQNALTTTVVADVKAKENELWGEKPPYMRISDNDLQIIADMAALGLYFSPTKKDDKEAQINSLRTMFAQNKIRIHSRCKLLIHQLQVGIWNKSRTDFERLPGAGHLDGLMALVYLNRMIDRNHNPMPALHGFHASTHFIPPTRAQDAKRYSGLKSIIGRR